MYDMFSEQSDDIILDMIDQVYTESFINDTEDIFYNKVPYENGDINLLFIIGYSGSGKSTMSNNEKKISREVVDMDKIVLGSSKDDKYFKKMGKFAYSFVTGPGKKYRKDLGDVANNLKYGNDVYRKAISKDIIKYAVQYAASHNSIRLVMEGVWIYRYINPSDLDSFAVYIKGTSLKTSTERALSRDNATLDKENASKGYKALRTVGKLIYSLKDALLGNLERYQSYFIKKSSQQPDDKISIRKKIINSAKRKSMDTRNFINNKIDNIIYKESEDKEIRQLTLG